MVERAESVGVVEDETLLRPGDITSVLIPADAGADARAWLTDRGFAAISAEAALRSGRREEEEEEDE